MRAAARRSLPDGVFGSEPGGSTRTTAGRASISATTRVVAEVDVRPSVVRVLPPGSLPKTPSGKLRRGAARELLG